MIKKEILTIDEIRKIKYIAAKHGISVVSIPFCLAYGTAIKNLVKEFHEPSLKLECGKVTLKWMRRGLDKDMLLEIAEDFGVKDIPLQEPNDPTICPLLSIAIGSQIEEESDFQNCKFEKCWFYSRKMKMCAIVIQALAQSNIAMFLSGTTQLKDYDRIMQSLKRQHRPQ